MATEKNPVRVGKVPGKVHEFMIEGESTVGKMLAEAGLDYSGYEVRLNNSPATLDDSVKDGDSVLLLKKIKGNI